MQLTKQTDYAFRSLLFLAQLPQGQLGQMQQICDFYDISPNHISKIVMKLVNLGWVRSVRGKGGGICLNVPASEINLADVVKAFEPVLRPVNCDEPECRISAECTLRKMLGKAMSNFLKTLDGYTLQDILVPEISDMIKVVHI